MTSTSGPRFIQYFGHVLEAIKASDGVARPEDVCNWIKANVPVPQTEIDSLNEGGQSKFENRVHWASNYLRNAGLIDGSEHGVWRLTEDGRSRHLTPQESLRLFKEVHEGFQRKDSHERTEGTLPVSEQDDLPQLPRNPIYWFGGAVWGEPKDQLPRFLAEEVWQNGYTEDNEFSELVQKMRPGERIAIKATFVRKHRLPFDARGRKVSTMRIKATGTILENLGDGRTVRVAWDPITEPRDWYFYTYRTTLVGADPDDDKARRLIDFAFGEKSQDYEWWLAQPYFAEKYRSDTLPGTVIKGQDEDVEAEKIEEELPLQPTYDVASIIEEGCFLAAEEIKAMLLSLQQKKNIVLQGPPGTGKTWLAKRLAAALVGRDRRAARERIRVVQFHPSMSYEDFVQGYRPSGDGKLALTDGLFLEAVRAAESEPEVPFAVVIEEINRGNPAQIFGELLTLLEADKRSPDEAVELAYRPPGLPPQRLYLPANLYLVGTMNIADRSLALVDLALRRRFAFITLGPALNEAWQTWSVEKGRIPTELVNLIKNRILQLNKEIADDRSLGKQFRIGHSFVTPPASGITGDARIWFRSVIETEIVPLLDEYWYDSPDKVLTARDKLLDGI
jgi:5-methylcytosine-specific restriction protein B